MRRFLPWNAILRGLAVAVISAATAPAAEATAPGPLPRVASHGLCADQMALMLADRNQIVAVSDQATGPLSHFAKRADGVPVTWGSAEEIIASGAQVFLTSDKVDLYTAKALAQMNITVLRLPLANSWAEVEDLTRTVASALGQPRRGEDILADMHRRLKKLAENPALGEKRPRVVYYRPDGGGAGRGTFVDIAIEAAGFVNMQHEAGINGWRGVPIEQVVLNPPDAFIASYFDTDRRNASFLRRNPVLWSTARVRPTIDVPGKYWNCGTPLLVLAAETMARQRKRLFPTVSSGESRP